MFNVDTGWNLATLLTKLLDKIKRKELLQPILYYEDKVKQIGKQHYFEKSNFKWDLYGVVYTSCIFKQTTL